MIPDLPPPELHRPLPTDRITLRGIEHEVRADAAECAAIAARLGIPGVKSLACLFELRRPTGQRDGEFEAVGRLRARLLRECVISLVVFEDLVDERFRIRFVPEGQEADEPDPESDDDVPYSGLVIDLGEAVVEQLALTLDPYPRSPGAVLADRGDGAPQGPFAALARLARGD